MSSIYVVEVTHGEYVTRAVVVAASASDAAEPYEAEGRTVEVGRLGTYEPGDTGAAMHNRSGDEIVSGMVR